MGVSWKGRTEMFSLSFYTSKIYEMNLNLQNKGEVEVFILDKDLYPYELALWRYALGFHVELGQRFANPFRVDNVGRARIDYSRTSDQIILYDIYGWTGYTIFNLLRKVYGVSGTQKILNNFVKNCLTKLERKKIKRIPKPYIKPDIKYHVTHYSDYEAEYWDQYNISVSYLVSKNVFPVSKFWYTTKKADRYFKQEVKKERCYAIPGKGGVKLYFVDRKKPQSKFLHNLETGWANDSGLLGCTSFKDAAVIECNTDYEADWLLLGENHMPTTANSLELFLGDNDDPGRRYGEAFRQKHKIQVAFPEEEGWDVADIMLHEPEYLNYLIQENL